VLTGVKFLWFHFYSLFIQFNVLLKVSCFFAKYLKPFFNVNDKLNVAVLLRLLKKIFAVLLHVHSTEKLNLVLLMPCYVCGFVDNYFL